MAGKVKGSIGTALAVFFAFIALTAAAAAMYRGSSARVAADVIYFVGAVAVVGLALPLWLAARGRLTLPVWPSPGAGDNALGVLAVVFLFARVEMLVAIFAEGRDWGLALATFLGPAALNLAAVTATIGVLLPAFKRRMPVAAAAVLAALAWVVFHLARTLSFSTRDIPELIVVAVFGLGYALYYFWSRSLLLTAVLQHIVATTALVYGREYAFGAGEASLYFSLAAVGAYLIFVTLRRRTYAAQRFTHF
ncbi:MAG: hypothetical protein PVH29_13145 [Candidatus Zixiibacteriota bacterium]|jgi:membrane protease YdiL (CAAX protease family)